MIQQVAQARILFFMSIIFYSSGCTFFHLNGDGPKDKKYYSEFLPNGHLWELKWYRMEAFGKVPTSTKKGYRHYSAPGEKGLSGNFILWNHSDTYTSLIPDKNATIKKRPLISKDKSTIWMAWLLGIPYLGGKGYTYDFETGECISMYRFGCYFWGLFSKGSSILPQNQEEVLSLEGRPDWDSIPYIDKKGTCFLWGIFAYGSVNGKTYIQIAWIPIPL